MVAFSPFEPKDQDQEGRGTQRSQSSSLSTLLALSYWLIKQDRQRLSNMAIIVRNDAELYPLQCQEAIRQLSLLRTNVQQCEAFLDTLDPNETERVKPLACITKLAVLDYRLTECILTLAMFAPISQGICKERIAIHFELRRLFPILLNTYEDCLSQLDGLRVFEYLLRQRQNQRQNQRQDRKGGATQ